MPSSMSTFNYLSHQKDKKDSFKKFVKDRSKKKGKR